ncbi:hypothetical protein AYI70_g10320 [Smittium culicis]|uniref:Uncharacterized protein n=1 Tax=Smittium culicis TaxID=133412 RepID=A0A1R1X735_9FUNG|nr:hypothetical protein AYI70_g10320 [Smittium culicis]
MTLLQNLKLKCLKQKYFQLNFRDDKVELFKLWLEDKAAIWKYEAEQDEDTTEWTLTDWLGKTEKRFRKGKEKASKRDIFELVDNNLWWNLAQTSKDKTMDKLMKWPQL